MPTRDQKRAQKAFAATESVMLLTEKEKGDYRSLVLGLPALIHDCGLCQTVAFLQAKADHHKRVLTDLCQLLLRKSANEPCELGAAVREAELPRYQYMTMEALRYSEYLKRYAEAFLKPVKP